MFKIMERPEFSHAVKVMVPIDGGFREETFRARFRVLPGDEADLFDLGTADGLRDFLREAIIGLDNITDDQGKALVYSDELRDSVLNLTYVRQAMLRTYIAAITKAAPGN